MFGWVAQSARAERSAGVIFTRRVVLHVLTVAAVMVAVALVVALPHARRAARPRPEIPVSAGESASAGSIVNRMSAIDEAVRRGDLSTARAAWHAARRSLRHSQDWQQIAALGDAALKIADASGARQPWEADARQAYLGALFRARAAASLDGVLRATEAFGALGDHDVVEEGLRIAESTAARLGDAGGRDRVVAARVRLQGTASMTDVAGPSRLTSWDEGP
jgi:hypothetical protein